MIDQIYIMPAINNKYQAQMEKWRTEGYDVSDLEDLFK